MPYSDLWGALTSIGKNNSKTLESTILRASEPLEEYIPGIKNGEINTGTEIRFLKFLSDNACLIKLNNRELMLSDKEAGKIYIGWE